MTGGSKPERGEGRRIMKQKKRGNAADKGLALFFVVLICLFAFVAGVKTMQYFDGGASRTASETQTAANSMTAAPPAETPTTAASTTETPTTAPTTSSTSATSAAPASADRMQSGEKVVYLTFDDGPTANTDNILDVLEDNDVRGTFFVIHSYDGCEKQIRAIHERGHCVALHTYSHRYSIYRSEKTYFEDLEKISDLVYNATGVRSNLLRFPGGSSNTISRKYSKGIMTKLTKQVTENGYVYFDWNVDSGDASAVHVPADKIVRNSTAAIGQKKEIILLLHDAEAKTSTVEALPDIVAAYREAGYRFDVLSADSFVWHHKVLN